MPPWWPRGETWPPPAAVRSSDATRWFPVRLAIVFAVGLVVAGSGAIVLVSATARLMPWPAAGPIVVTLLSLAIVGLFVAAMRHVAAPLSDIVTAAHRVGDGDFSVRLGEQGLPWLRSVANAFNTMTARLERQQRERRALMADIAHELRTPVAVVQGRLEGMLDGVYPADPAHVGQVLDQTRMLARLVEDLRTSAHAESGTLSLQKEPVDLGVLMTDVASSVQMDTGERGVRIETTVSPDLPLVDVDPHRLQEVLLNLLSNALRHAPSGSIVSMDADRQDTSVVIRVQDDGPGIPPGDLARIFDRFYKGRDSTGSGLGLTIARSLVEAHGGTLSVANRTDGGTTFTVTLPLGDDEGW
jgi:signal transduction histidine kinase